jgi:chaperonin GroES
MSKSKMIPLHDRVVVLPTEAETKTAGGIVIPDTADKDKPSKGTVVSVGNGKHDVNGKLIPLQVKKDDQVLFGKYAGTNVKLGDKEYLVMREEDILAVLED